MTIDKNANKIIKQFIEFFKNEHSDENIVIEGILLFGSYVKPSNLSKNSDLDLYLVIKNNGKRYRGIKYIGGVEVDYFINPIEQLEYDYKNASKDTVFYMLAKGVIIKDKHNQLLDLCKSAKEKLEEKRVEAIPSFMATSMKYFINDYINDIQDNYEDKDFFALHYNTSLLLNYLIEVFCKNNNIPLVKPKYQKNEILKRDTKFIEFYVKCAESTLIGERVKNIKKLSDYVLENLGGKLPREWELKSPLRLM